MNLDEFMQAHEPEQAEPADLDVQKAVVESLAADKAELDEQKRALESALASKDAAIDNLNAQLTQLMRENAELRKAVAPKEEELAALKAEMMRMGDVLAQNTEAALSNQVALLDRVADLSDRFPGETRDHVLEVIQEARDAAESAGRLRRAQLLEGVLVANEPSGALRAKREELKNLFAENMNVLSGPVLAELDKMGIAYKQADDYLTTVEIMQRTY